MNDIPSSIDDTAARLLAHDYVADRQLATVVYLALKLQRPLFLEGEPGTGKTEIARTLATLLGRDLIRLQCYEGLDLNSAAYEWNYGRQMMEIRLAEREGLGRDALSAELFSERFLHKRALLQAIDPARAAPPVLLIDELDRADEEFEAFLLELLSDWQISIPEIGTLRDRLATLHRFVDELFRGVGLVLEEEEALLHYLLSLSPQEIDEPGSGIDGARDVVVVPRMHDRPARREKREPAIDFCPRWCHKPKTRQARRARQLLGIV